MSQDTQRVLRHGKVVTFHPNKGTSNRGFIYSGSRRFYGWIEKAGSDGSVTVFRMSSDVQRTEGLPSGVDHPQSEVATA